LYYIESPITSSSHSFGTTTTFPTIIAAAFSNTATSAIFDGQQNHADAQASPAQGGSVTPVSANSMVLSGVVASDSAISSVDSSFSVIQDRTGTGGVSYGTALAYLVETTIAAQNPAWTHTAANIGVWNGSFAPVSAGSYTVVLIRS
jgi:hypothetical protein